MEVFTGLSIRQSEPGNLKINTSQNFKYNMLSKEKKFSQNLIEKKFINIYIYIY